jgi:nucleoid-associated protein YgaU
MIDRNEKRDILLNNHELYKTKLRERGLKSFKHYSKMKMSNIAPEDMKNLNIIDHIFVTGDSLAKLAYKYYGDTRYWWILAVFNKKPIDNLIKMGETIHIPLPLEEAHYLINRDE